MHGEARIVALGPGDGTAIADPLEGAITVKARSLESGGALEVFERELAVGECVGEHAHAGQEEAVYVLAGELLLRLGPHTHRARAGGFLLVPRGVAHAVENAGPQPARMLCVRSPCAPYP